MKISKMLAAALLFAFGLAGIVSGEDGEVKSFFVVQKQPFIAVIRPVQEVKDEA
jgi:hypothetical protein